MIPPYPGPAVNRLVNIELGNSNEYKLYNLADDLSQQENLAEKEPEKLQEMIDGFMEARSGTYIETRELELH